MNYKNIIIDSKEVLDKFFCYFSPYLKHVGLPEQIIEKSPVQLPLTKFAQLFQLSASDGRPNLGLIIGSEMKAEYYGAIGYAISNAETLERALNILVKNKVIYNQGGDWVWEELNGLVKLSNLGRFYSLNMGRQMIEYMMASSVTMIRKYLGSPIKFNSIEFVHEKPQDTVLHNEIFDCPISFSSSENSISFNASYLSCSSLDSDPRLLNALLPYLESSKLANSTASIIQNISHVIFVELHTGKITLEFVCRKIGVSVRTAQRYLDIEQITFSKLLDNIRKQLAFDYLLQTNNTIYEISDSLGYKNCSSFSRSFSRWTGISPKQYKTNHSKPFQKMSC